MCKCNNFSLNPTKSESMVVTNKRFVARPQLLVGSDLIKKLSSFEHLRGYIETQLKYKVQVKYIKS